MAWEEDLFYLKRAVEVSKLARQHGNTPFGAILVNADGEIVLEQENIEITEKDCTGHAETALVRAASKQFSKKELSSYTIYTTAEPCCMCSGTIYWSNLGRVVYGISEQTLKELTGDDPQNPTLDLPCREVFAKGQKQIEVVGPIEAIEQAVIEVHSGYWK
jgi:tRNA(Arg) A34 adenosine deaminase TadA